MTTGTGRGMGWIGRARRWLPALALPPLVGAAAIGPLAASGGADTSLLGYNASALAIGAQFAFNVPGVVPLPNENLIEDDVPFARINVGAGPVVDSIGAPYYPGDIAASLGTLLQTFGAPALPLNDPLLAESKYPTSPGYPASVTFPKGAPSGPVQVAQGTATTSTGGGTAAGTVSNLSLANLLSLSKLPVIGGVLSSTSGSPIDVGNISATNNVVVGNSAITSTATSTLGAIDIAGLVDIAGLTSTAVATSDGTTGTPTATVHLGDVTVDGTEAYIDDTGRAHRQEREPARRRHAGAAPADRRLHAGTGRREHPFARSSADLERRPSVGELGRVGDLVEPRIRRPVHPGRADPPDPRARQRRAAGR